jgi:hypothetical protein
MEQTLEMPETQEAAVVTETQVTAKAPGRPANPTSARQIKLAERAARLEAGGLGIKGRPTNESSARQIKLAERAALIEAGVVIKRGRKALPKAEVVESPAAEVVADEPTAE